MHDNKFEIILDGVHKNLMSDIAELLSDKSRADLKKKYDEETVKRIQFQGFLSIFEKVHAHEEKIKRLEAIIEFNSRNSLKH